VARERVDFLAVDEELHGGDCRQIRRHRVDDGVHREQLVDGAARVRGGDFTAQIDERLALLGDEQRAQRRPRRHRRYQRLGDRADLRRDDLARLLGGVFGVRDVAFDSGELGAALADVEQPRLDLASGRRRRGRRRRGHRARRPPSRRAAERPDEHGRHQRDGGDRQRAARHGVPPAAMSVSR
jgi:hypothetical protein